MNRMLFHSAGARSGRTSIVAKLLAASLLLFFAAAALPAQTADDGPIRELISRLDKGETEAVRQQLPEMVAKYQNHPGILYVQARVATDGIEAAKLYQSILDNYPSSEWADDALYNLYQYYYAMGLYMTAELKMQQLRKEYPNSEHLTGKSPPGKTPEGQDRPKPAPVTPPVRVDTVKKAPPTREIVTRDTARPATVPAPVRIDTVKKAPPAREIVTRDTARPTTVRNDTTLTRPPARDQQTGAQVEPKDAPARGAMPYTLQTGAFSTSENAQEQKAWFEERGYTVEINNRVRGGRSLYLVWVSSFPNADEARKVLRDIQARYNITAIVVER